MSLHTHSPIFYILKNREIDSLYVMNTLSTFARSLISIFIPIYFYQLGFPIWIILVFYFLRAAYFIVFTYFSLPLVRQLSEKMMIFIGTPFLVIALLLINSVNSLNWMFFAAPAAFALYSMFFFAGYHFDFSRSADKKDRGKEIGLSYVIMDITRFTSPFIGGLIIGASGFHVTFLVASIILIISIIPLFFFPRRNFSQKISSKSISNTLKDKKLKNFRRATFGYVMEKANTVLIWPLFIFLFVGSVETVGEYISFGLLAGAIAAYIAGRLSDKGKNRQLFTITGIAQSMIWLIRTTVQSIGAIIGINIAGYIFREATVSSWFNRFYTLIQNKKDRGAYIMGQEMYFNIVRIIVYPLLILASLIFTTQVFFPIAFALAGIFSLFFILAGR